MAEEPKTTKMLAVDRGFLLIVTFVLGVFVSLAIIYYMIPIADPTPWIENVLMMCVGFFIPFILLKNRMVIIDKEKE